MTKTSKIPMRKCVGCNEMKPKTELVRVLRQTDQSVVIDTSGKANGRGAYLCKNEACLQKAMKTKALERSLKTPISPEVFEYLREELS
ncbi:MAG: YlxR family protein [Lachnospiraceae bacterium]|nr:YlxR family protein [Lachnospiraceae bacterium]